MRENVGIDNTYCTRDARHVQDQHGPVASLGAIPVLVNTPASAREQVIAEYLADLDAALSGDRLSSYRPPGPGAVDLDTVATYLWNVTLSRDLYLSLAVVEVTMRNSVHKALSRHASGADWYDQVHLLPRETPAVSDVKRDLARSGKPITPGRLIAGLPFGFWTSILSRGAGQHGYGGTIWSPDNAAAIRFAFPHLTATNQNRSFVHRRFNAIRHLRNRTMHHEPIWRGMAVRDRHSTTMYPLADLYDDILDAIGWTSPRLRDSVLALDRFPQTLRDGPGAYKSEIETFLQI